MGDYKPIPGKIPGTSINLGGRDFVLPPLSLNSIRKFEKEIPKLGKGDNMKQSIDEALPVIHAALERNYPDITVDDVGALIDMGNFLDCIAALIRVSGYTEAKSGEPAPASP